MPFTQLSENYIRDAFCSSNYDLLEKIGEGGFGKVFKAFQRNTGQTVAIKVLVLDPHLEPVSHSRYIERFHRETALCSKLNHPNIVRLLDKGQCSEHLLFAVFEYVDGQTLRNYLNSEGELAPLEVQDLMLQVLDALIHAHKKGVIHRDIKPNNIMLAKGGAKLHAKILDFGIGTLTLDSRQNDFNTLTLTQETLGTPSYSAPEQLRGEPATESTDLYVWGLLFLECLTGVPAVTGSSIASVYHQQLSDIQIPIPGVLLGHPIASLLRRVLHKNPIERVIKGHEVFAELSRLNMANLVGSIGAFKNPSLAAQETVVLRADAPDHPTNAEYTFLTERKQITVLAIRFSITLLEQRESDLDVLDTLFKSQRGHCLDIATRFGAFHVGSLGDTTLFYFGFPSANDNDTRLCARTILEVISDLGRRNALMKDIQGATLNAHAGIHTGVFTTYANNTPEGHVANAALELARQAQSNQVLCSLETRSLLEPYCAFEAHRDLCVGLSVLPDRVFKLSGERRNEAFGFMRGMRNNHEFVGREPELEQLLPLLSQLESSSRLVYLHGEAGIGKSRLLQEVRNKAPNFQHLVSQCLPEHQNNALYPVLTLIRNLYNTSTLNAESASGLFSQLLSHHSSRIDLKNALSILMMWLNIEFDSALPDSARPDLTLTPEQQKSILFDSLGALLKSSHLDVSINKLYIFEDLHWADNTTLEFIQQFSNTLQPSDVLISTSRQTLPQQFRTLAIVDVFLKKLTKKETEGFIVKLFDEQCVSRNVLDILINRTDGIPLFIEELVDMIKQKELISLINGEINFVSPEKLDQVPSSLRESLQQKLDSLKYAKETAQLAATIGREFEYDLLVAASSLSENQIQNDINELIDKDLIIQLRQVDNNSYIFKHALVRDAAYDSVAEKDRVLNHAKIAEKIILLEKEDNYTSALFNHLYHSKQYVESAKYAYVIAKSDSNLGAYKSAYDLLTRCIEPVSQELVLKSPSLFIKINCLKISCLVALEGSGSKEIIALSSYNQKIIDCVSGSELSDDFTHYLHHSNWSIMTFHHMTSNRKKALNLAMSEANNASTLNYTDDQKLVTYVQVANCYLLDGQTQDCLSYIQKALDIFSYKNREFTDNSCIEYGFSSKSFLYMIKASVEAAMKNAEAKESIETAIRVSRNAKSPISELITLGYGAICGYLLCDNAFISWCLAEMARLLNRHADMQHFSMYLNIPTAFINGDVNELENAIQVMEQSAQTQWLSLYKCMLIDILIAKGCVGEARRLIQNTLDWCDSTNEKVMYDKLKQYETMHSDED
ncbi:Adenylate cyclase [Pseudoalteromonas luteoviolacea B = ATCC 29581]|nr:Adenylate cyclase [Pseudoalteromonas luteoviolacea B = ATCC 29581]